MSPLDLLDRESAARELDLNLVVTAGAGTGKTSLLIERILHHVLERGTPLERLAAITFTVKAAAELRERLEDALERALLLSTRPDVPPKEKEADRVLARLDGATRAKVPERSQAALEALDRATLSTIHSFASEILRRHHREAGVDVGFQVDEGNEAGLVFDELWAEHLERVLGSGPEPQGWRNLLLKLSIDNIEEVARHLVKFSFPLEALGEDCEEVERAYQRVLAGSWLAEVKEIRGTLRDTKGLNVNLLPCLERLELILKEMSRTGMPVQIPEELEKSCSVGKNVHHRDREGIERRLRSLLKGVRDLAQADSGIARDLALALRPFVTEFRSEYLCRGYISYDGLIVLARDLLRDHPHLRRAEAQRFDHILVDEFQDTDPLQYEIIFFLAEAVGARLAPGKLFIVGDGKQSIYRFRGADIGAYRRAVEKVRREGGRVLTLRANFRSVPELVEPLNALFEPHFAPGNGAGGLDPEFDWLAAERGPAGTACIEIWSVGEPSLKAEERRRAEAEAIAGWLRTQVDAGKCSPRQVAILLYSQTEVDILLRPLRLQGIPYLFEGGKRFYQRYEVEILLALLRAVLNPAHSIALVSCLRSPLGAVPDRELQLFAAQPGSRGPAGPWTIAALPDPGQLPCLSRALSWLGRFRERHRDDAIDRMSRAALDETPLRLAMAASYEGAQRVANLEKVVRRIGLLARDGRLTSEEVLDRIEREDAFQTAEGDSPLSDETTDAVRILSIHKAKGLEWPVVILPDLARDLKKGGRGERVAAARDPREEIPAGERRLPSALALDIGEVKTPAWIGHRMHEDRARAAEHKRLLYVAATRAQDRLVLVCGTPEKGSSTWIEPLRAWGYEIAGGFPTAQTFREGQVLHRRLEKPGKPRAAGGEESPDRSLVEGARRFESAVRKLSEEKRAAFRSPSALRSDRLDLDPSGEAPVERTSDLHGRRVARAAGTAIHLLLEVWDRKDSRWLIESAGKAARVAAARARIEPEPVLARVRAVLEKAEGRVSALLGEEPLGREVPILYRDPDGTIWEGTIDLLAGSPDSPEVVDYKSDSSGSPRELLELHGPQIALYSRAVQRALGLPASPPARLELLSSEKEP